MNRKPRKISTFDTRFLIFTVFAFSFYHYSVSFVLPDAEYILRAPYITVVNLFDRILNIFPNRKPVQQAIEAPTFLKRYLPSENVPVLQYVDTGYVRYLLIPQKKFKKNDVVVFNNCLIGRVSMTGVYVARVQLITDPAHYLPVVCCGVNAMSVGKDGNTVEIIRFQKPLISCANDDGLVYTSGVDGIYPRNLIVGKVDKIKKSVVLARSILDFNHIDYVEVLSFEHLR